MNTNNSKRNGGLSTLLSKTYGVSVSARGLLLEGKFDTDLYRAVCKDIRHTQADRVQCLRCLSCYYQYDKKNETLHLIACAALQNTEAWRTTMKNQRSTDNVFQLYSWEGTCVMPEHREWTTGEDTHPELPMKICVLPRVKREGEQRPTGYANAYPAPPVLTEHASYEPMPHLEARPAPYAPDSTAVPVEGSTSTDTTGCKSEPNPNPGPAPGCCKKCCGKGCCRAFLLLLVVILAFIANLFDNFVMDSCRNKDRIVSENGSVITKLQAESTSLSRDTNNMKDELPALDFSVTRDEKKSKIALESLDACRESEVKRRVECDELKIRESNFNYAYFAKVNGGDDGSDDDRRTITDLLNVALGNAARKTEQCRLTLKDMCTDKEKQSADADEDLLVTKKKREDIARNMQTMDAARTRNLEQLHDARSYVSASSFKSLESMCDISNSMVDFVARVGSVLLDFFEKYQQVKEFVEWGVRTFRQLQEL